MAIYKYKTPQVSVTPSSAGNAAGGGEKRYNGSKTRSGAELQARTIRKKPSSGTPQGAKKAKAVRKKRIMKHYMIRKLIRRRQNLKERKKSQEQSDQRADAAAVSQAETALERGTQEVAIHTVRAAWRTGKAAHALYGATRQRWQTPWIPVQQKGLCGARFGGTLMQTARCGFAIPIRVPAKTRIYEAQRTSKGISGIVWLGKNSLKINEYWSGAE